MYSGENYDAIRGFMTEELWNRSRVSFQNLGEVLSKK